MHQGRDRTKMDSSTQLTILANQAFSDAADEINYLASLDPQEFYSFSINLHSLRLYELTIVTYNIRVPILLQKDEIFVKTEINEDFLMPRENRKSKAIEEVNQRVYDMKSHFLGERTTQPQIEVQAETKWQSKGYPVEKNGAEIFSTKQLDQPISYLMIEFLAVAIGPKHCDFELRDYRSGKPMGRIFFDISVAQLQMIEVDLHDLTCKFNHKEDRPLYTQFKAMHNNDIPKISEPTATQTGKFKKDKNQTHFKWKHSDNLFETQAVQQEVSLESLKNSTLQLLVKIDGTYTDQQKARVLEKVEIMNRKSRLSEDQSNAQDGQEDMPFIIEDLAQNNESQTFQDKPSEHFLMAPKEETIDRIRPYSPQNQKNRNQSVLLNFEQKSNLFLELTKNKSVLNQNGDSSPVTGDMRRSRSIKSNMQRNGNVMTEAKDYYKSYSKVDDRLATETDLVGECYLGFSKLLQSEYRQYERKESFILQNKMSFVYKQNLSQSFMSKGNSEYNGGAKARLEFSLSQSENPSKKAKNEKKSFQEQLWFMGKVIGSIKGNFKVTNIPIMQQMALGILTEKGIVMNQIPMLIQDGESGSIINSMKRSQKNEKITQLIDLTQQLKKLDIQKQKARMASKQNNEKEKILHDIQVLIKDDHKHVNSSIFKYQDELDLIRGQYALIELAFHCLMFAENVRYEFKRDYYEILQFIMNRGELKLNHLALSSDMLQQSSTGNNKQQTESSKESNSNLPFEKIKQEKIKVAQFYQKLLFQTLDDCLTKFCRKDVEPYMRSYLENQISLGFFRVPKFQTIFLECLKNEDQEMFIQEWKGVNWDLNDKSEYVNQGLIKLFDWQLHFFQHIPTSPEVEDANRCLRRVEVNQKWQTRIKKRSVAYFQIIRNWSEFIQKTVQTYSLFWQDIPGYRYILKSIIIEMKTRPVNEYPDPLIDATLALINNSSLLTVFVQIVFLKTNAYDSETLQSTMSLVLKWINQIERMGLQFPSNFDFPFFFKGILISLEIDHSITIPRTMYVLYKTLHFLPIDQRSFIINEVLSKFFYKLFFSWSYTVRDVFMSLLLYQIEYAYFHRTTSYLGMMEQSFVRSFKEESQTLQSSGSLVQKEHIRMSRQKSLDVIKNSIKQYKQILEQNPNDAVEAFDRQINLRNSRISELGRHHFITQKTTVMSTNLDAQIDMPTLQNSSSANDKVLIGRNSQQTQILQGFIRDHNVYRRKIKEILVLEQYFNQQDEFNKSSSKSFNQLQSASFMMAQSNQINNTESLSRENFMIDISSDSSTDKSAKIIECIPKELRVYIKHALKDFIRNEEEFEEWKKSLHLKPSTDFISSLPDFNMEKSMPVEDDENLEKAEEW
ncbi:UNKNOWN [Stylonychia lemnae]|uniref:Uncharacterized protein n=1 Tax=Stylonychia lemnae TaxID=5949 RepID=A0A078AE31_STYLE|nr:UNKNOWN [Stylonychia lemnae]|eukprot:CDW79777.1 UNKNOWN [Stylonychia lemnae]